ncbi:MAG: hypothetical protein EAZ28_30920 [Oscillatoriales cyanobacterium]|nr:MAG: hypothetical protein EAZ28_30920 [Oscillatoriales cyanobacterium]
MNSFKNSSQKNQRLVSAKSTIELLNIKTKNLGSSKKPGFFSYQEIGFKTLSSVAGFFHN